MAATAVGWAALLVLAPASAFGQVGSTTVSYSGSPDTNAQIAIQAAPRAANRISIRDAGDPGGLVYFSIRDLAAPVIAPTSTACTQASPNEVRCDTTGLRSLTVSSGDGADIVVIRNLGIGDSGRATAALDHDGWPIIGFAGAGNDQVKIRSGIGRVFGQGGRDILAGGAGPQRLFGGDGNDLVGAAGKGKDLCYGGPGKDRGGIGCEKTSSMLYDPASGGFFDIGGEL